MAGAITAKYRLVTKLFGAYHEEIKRLLKRPKTNANEVDNAGLIGTYDWKALLQPARDDLAAHIARKDDPHQETMATHGSYTATQINSKLGVKIPNAILPVSNYGFVDRLTDAQINAAWTFSGWVLYVGIAFQVTLAGTVYRLPVQQVSLLVADPFPQNKTFYVYVRSQFGYVTYEVRSDAPPESESIMYIGTVTTNGSGIVSRVFAGAIRITTFRLSSLPVGSAIPVSGGTYDNIVALAASWNPV